MAFQPAPDVAEAVIQFTNGVQQYYNVVNFLKSGGYDQTAINNLAGVIDTAVGTNFRPIISTGLTYVGTLVRGLSSVNDLQTYQNTAAGAGAATGGLLAANLSLCITLRSAFTGRSARGRFYCMPPVVPNMATQNTVTSTYRNSCVAAVTSLRTAAATASWVMVVLSRRSGGVPRPSAVTFVVSQIAARNDVIDHQDGRLPDNH